MTELLPGLDGPAPKGHFAGTHRLVAPEETLARVAPSLRTMGITRIANVTGLDCIGIPVVMVCRPNSRSLAVSQGKGLTLAAAKASGVMESVESFHSERIDAPLRLASYEELRRRHRVVDVDELPKRRKSRFHPHLPLLWIEGFDLIESEPIWLPYELVDLNFTLPLPSGIGCFAQTSNGLASGNHLLEAISHAICELVERDATTLFGLRPEEARGESRIDLDTVDDAGCRWVLERFAPAGVEVAVWETTSDIGLPSFSCKITERSEGRLRRLGPGGGFGCHPERGVALLRALTEAAQGRLTLIAGSRDDMRPQDYDEARNLDTLRGVRAAMAHDGPKRDFAQAPTSAGATFEEDVRWELERLKAVGISRVVLVDVTRRELGLPVARVVAPGIEGHAGSGRNYAPGRRARAMLESRR
ncbi:MAG: hypothetical protein GEU88_11770 [Solirubrobacterales bacterium]|nr:hypothetical protein [Solirubrobacterales bacterium]